MRPKKLVLQMKYKKGSLVLNSQSLPDLNHLSSGFYCCDAEILGRGEVIGEDGNRYEYQDLRVIVKERGV